MDNLLYDVMVNVKLEEGTVVLENLLLSIYFKEGISTKELAREVLLPVPVIAAIKNEFKKRDLIVQDRGIRLTQTGRDFIEKTMKYEGLDTELYHRLINDNWSFEKDFKKELDLLNKVFEGRPQVDVTVDQSKCTVETSIKRAILCLKNKALIGKRILCVGDDDLVSISLSFLVKKLFPKQNKDKCLITVLDIDERFLRYIENTAELENLPIQCHKTDLRQPLADKLINQYDCFFTDPPYTMPGMELFLSRGISALKKESGLTVFFSFAHKTPDFNLNMQWAFLDMGLIISDIKPRFNKYEGAEIIGNTGQMIILKTTRKTEPMINDVFDEELYTGEIRRTVRIYQCKECKKQIEVGDKKEYRTIEVLKESGCPYCKGSSFDIIDKLTQES